MTAIPVLSIYSQPFNLQTLSYKSVEKWFKKSSSADSDFFSGQPLFLNQEKRWIHNIKPTFLLIFGTLSLGGCGEQGCYF
jgi:hypothetical protein